MAIREQQAEGAKPSTVGGHRARYASASAVAADAASTPGSPGGSGELADGEIRLVERARSGDTKAFDMLVALRLMPTFRLVRAILGGMEEAEDATQEAFIAAWRALPTLRKPERFDAWFGRIVVNACRMSIRRRRKAVVVSIDSITERKPAMADDPWLTGLVESDALNRAIDRLSVEQRTILGLYYLEDRPVSSVARILGIPTGTAKWRLSLARLALRRALAADDGGVSVLARLRRPKLGPGQTPAPQPEEPS
jgi:RNA polymerase sigma-70 factor (ECF subfamily)